MRTPAAVPHRRRSGSAIVATLAVVAALTLLAILVSRVLRLDQRYVLVREARTEALAWAEAGLAIASHPGISRSDPALRFSSAEGDGGAAGGFEVAMTSEDARININAVLMREDKQFLRDLFEFWGMDLDAADALIDAMADWVDGDDLASLNGAETEAYEELGLPGLPPNRFFRSTRELRYVLGAADLDLLRPGWESRFSVRASGRLDLFDAPPDLIVAACGVPIEAAERFIELRWGDDGIPESDDDPPMTSIEEALALLGTPDIPMEVLQQRVGVKTGLVRITSTGKVGRVSRTLGAVVAKGRGQTRLIWRGEVAQPEWIPPVQEPEW